MPMVRTPAEVGGVIRDRRSHLGLTREALATAAGVSVSTLAKIESGRYSGEPYTLPKIANAIGVTLAHLRRGADVTGDGAPGLVEWLREQLDADERVALEVRGQWILRKLGRTDLAELITGDRSDVVVLDGPGASTCAEHIVRWDPARVLAEVAAKREIVRDYEERRAACLSIPSGDGDGDWHDEGVYTGLRRAVQALAQPYAGRPGWRAEWAAERTTT